MAQGDIVIDAAEIVKVTARLEALRTVMVQLDNGTAAVPFTTPLSALAVAAGNPDTFGSGKNLAAAVLAMGKKVYDRTQSFATNSERMIQTLHAIADRAEHVESLNSLAASEFGKYSSSTTPPVTPPTTEA